MKSKKILLLLMILCLIFSFTACGKSKIADKRGHMLKYELNKIEKDGFYIKNTDGTYTPVMSAASGYKGITLEESKSRHIWFTDNIYNLSSLIPKLTSETELVLISNTDKGMPSTYTLERYIDLGYSIGVKLYIGNDGKTVSFKTTSGNFCPTSSIGNGITNTELPTEVTLSEFNKSEKLPLQAINRDINILTGLEKGESYQVGFYYGTKYYSKETKADTRIFQADTIYELQTPFTKTKEGYFIINMPSTAKEGYYYICDEGLFYYEK